MNITDPSRDLNDEFERELARLRNQFGIPDGKRSANPFYLWRRVRLRRRIYGTPRFW